MRVQVRGCACTPGPASVLAEQTALSGPSDGLYPPRARRWRRFPRPCPKRMLLQQTSSTSHGLRALAGPEDRRPDADHRGPARDGDLQVAAHSHRELGQDGRAAMQVAQEGERLEDLAG